MANNDTFSQIVELVVKHRWHFNRELTRADRLSEDLGMDGDDAAEFLQEYSKKFNVDLSAMNFEEYFAGEGINPVYVLTYLFGKKKYKSVTLGDLERFAAAGKWLSE